MQVRAARGMLNWSRDRLSAESGVPKRTLAGFEGGETAPRAGTIDAIRAAFEAAGVEFTNGDALGVRLVKRPAGSDPSDE